MKNKITMQLMPDSSFLLGGVSVNPAYDAVTALEDNLPYLTATAVKGALRMDFEAFVKGTGETGLCELDDTDFHGCGNCLSCQLFGGGNKEGKLRFNAAFMEKGKTLFDKNIRTDILEKGRREGVSISRTLGKAKEGSYYSTLTFPNLKDIQPITFVTHIDIREKLADSEYKYLDAFFAFMGKTGLFMGSKKSVGLGHFKLTCHIPPEFEEPGKPDTSKKELKLFRVTLKTLEPLVVGDLKNKYIINTLPYLPASTVGGSIGFGFLKNGIDEEVVSELFNDKHSFSPFNFYLRQPFPTPTSMRAKKGEKEVKDIMLSDFIVKKAIDDGKFEAAKGLFEALYRSTLRPVPICHKPGTTYHTKVAIGRVLQKTREGMLYSMELIPKDSRFYGLVIGETWTKEALINMKHLFIGGKRTRGFGRTGIEEVEEIGTNELLNPGVSIDAELRKMAKDFSITIPGDRCYFALDVLADLVVPAGKNLKMLLEEEFFPGLEMIIEKSYPELIRRGGYDFYKKKEKPLMQKIGAGSTFLVSVPLEKEKIFTGKVAGKIEESINYKWDSTPLFMLNNPGHKETWR